MGSHGPKDGGLAVSGHRSSPAHDDPVPWSAKCSAHKRDLEDLLRFDAIR